MANEKRKRRNVYSYDLYIKKDLHFCKSFCSSCWARTSDPLINSQML